MRDAVYKGGDMLDGGSGGAGIRHSVRRTRRSNDGQGPSVRQDFSLFISIPEESVERRAVNWHLLVVDRRELAYSACRPACVHTAQLLRRMAHGASVTVPEAGPVISGQTFRNGFGCNGGLRISVAEDWPLAASCSSAGEGGTTKFHG